MILLLKLIILKNILSLKSQELDGAIIASKK